MSRLGAKQTLKVYSLVLSWSVFVFWAGFTFGTREPVPGPGQDRSLQLSAESLSPLYRSPPRPRPLTPEPVVDPVPPEMFPSNGEEIELELPTLEPAPAYHTVQVAAVRTQAEGRHLLMKLGAKGHHGRIVPPSGSGGFYRVWVGECEGESEAREIEETLKKDGFSTYLRRTAHARPE